MLIERSAGAGDIHSMMSVLATERNALSGAFGFSWALGMQVAGWILQGIGLGKSLWDATREAGEKIPPGETLDQQDVATIATQLHQRMPTTSQASWESLLREAMAGKVIGGPAAPVECPPGFYRDPVTGACLEGKKAFAMPIWGWPVAIIGGIVLLPQVMSLLKMGR